MAYVDSRGAEMPDMTYSEALEIVHGLASGNLPDEADAAFGDGGIAGMARQQSEALGTLQDLITNHHENIDADFPAPEAAGDWPEGMLASGPDLDPAVPSHCIRICLDMAEQALPDPSTVRGVAEADEFDRSQQAVDIVSDFIGLHGSDLDHRVTSFPVGGILD
jgi:hypothetical protein